MRTRKFLSTLIPALPMLLTALLVILVTVIFLTAMRSKAHAQFGGVEQPMFQLTSVQESQPTPLTNGLAYWWVASDLPAGTVSTGWVDRIQGMRLTNGIVANRPTVVSNYVSFSNSYLSNAFPSGTMAAWTWCAIISSPGPWTGFRCFIDKLADGLSSSFAGYYFRSNVRLYNGTVSLYDLTSFTNGVIFDICDSRTNNTDLERVWTNGVFAESHDHGAGGMNLGPRIGFGRNADQINYPWTGKVYDIMIYTNPGFPHSLIVSNIHWYGTNKYGQYYVP